ncbi:MAG: response regulator [Dehalococcoidales bacterium]|nr:response regulator [Dehalococcoidales bacterium]
MPENKATILVVDDEAHVRKLLQQILGDAGYNIITASTGHEAFEKISSSNDIDLVLLDIIMPGIDGFKTLELIRAQSDTPVIMITGLGEVSPLQFSFNLGADDYIKKPFRAKELLARIDAKVRRSKD